jgi:hypothetical protein
MNRRYWEFESIEVAVPDSTVDAVRNRLLELIPQTFCTDVRFRSDGYPGDIVSCVMDAVGSVGVRYISVIRGLEKFRTFSEQQFQEVPTTPQNFLLLFRNYLDNPDLLAESIWTRQRTSTRGGILKVEAMVRWMSILDEHDIQTPSELLVRVDDRKLKKSLLSVPGQSKYVSLIYFFMLAGYRDGVKDDRMIERWFSDECKVDITTPQKAVILMILADELLESFPCMNAAELDHLIWLVASNRWSSSAGWINSPHD